MAVVVFEQAAEALPSTSSGLGGPPLAPGTTQALQKKSGLGSSRSTFRVQTEISWHFVDFDDRDASGSADAADLHGIVARQERRYHRRVA
jgi:hypothetical protein